jgi:hypothetical protein
MARFFSNQGNKKTTQVLAPTKSNATKRPRATNAEDLFAKEQRTQLRDAMKLQRDKLGVSSLTKEENLALYRSVKADTYNSLLSSDKEIWEARAGKYNEEIKDLPSLEHIYE